MNYTNIRLITDKLKRHPLLEDLPFETIVDYTVDFIRIVGMPDVFLEKTKELDVIDYRAQLPCDYYSMIQVRLVTKDNNVSKALRYSTDSFHMSSNKKDNYSYGFTYKLQGNCIITSIPKCKIELAYRALPIDDEGYPLIPDNSSYSRALELYIKLQYFTILFDMGKIQPAVLNNTQQQYAWAVGQAQTDLVRPSLDEMEAISNMWNKLLPDSTDDHNTGYLNEGTKEHLILH